MPDLRVPRESVTLGGLKTFRLDGREVLIARSGDDEYFAVAAICTHQHARLDEGELIGHELECPLHGGSFDVRSGEVLAPPPELGLTTYRTRLDGDQLVIVVDD